MTDIAVSYFGGRVSVRFAKGVPFAVAALVIAVIVVGITSLLAGSYDLAVWDIPALLSGQGDKTALTVLWDLRMPRFVAACLVGGLLAVSGALLQGATRNPLADPSLVGVSQGASFAVVSLIVLWPNVSIWARPIAAFAGGVCAAMLIQWLSAGKRGENSLRFILVGIGVAAIISAGTSALLTYGQINRASSALGWMAGSVHTASWGPCAVLAICAALCVPALIWVVRPLTALRFGPELAIGFGLPVGRAKFGVITLAVAMAAFAVAAAGPIGFVGLLAPQMAQRLTRAGVGAHLILSALGGAVLVSAADLLGRTIAAPIQFPAGLISAVVGVPIFVLLILKRANSSQL